MSENMMVQGEARPLTACCHALEAVLGSLRFAEKVTTQSRQIEALAQVHRLLRTTIPSPEDPAQLPLF